MKTLAKYLGLVIGP